VFLDADLLLLPPNGKPYKYPKLMRTMKKRRRLLVSTDSGAATDKSSRLSNCTSADSSDCSSRRRLNFETDESSNLNTPPTILRPPLHLQPEFTAFLANPRANLLTSTAPPGIHKVPRKVGNNLNNTVSRSLLLQLFALNIRMNIDSRLNSLDANVLD